MLDIVQWIHLVAAATWTGGLITLGALVVALRKAGAERSLLQGAARQFARLSWTAMAIALVTGVAQVQMLHMSWSYGRLHIKLGFVGAAILLAGFHQFTARSSSPAMRGAIQGLILLVSLAIFGAAVHLR